MTARFETVNKKLRGVNTPTGEVGTQAGEGFRVVPEGRRGAVGGTGMTQIRLHGCTTRLPLAPKDNAIEFLRRRRSSRSLA